MIIDTKNTLRNSWIKFKSNYGFTEDPTYIKAIEVITSIASNNEYPHLTIPSSIDKKITKHFSLGYVSSDEGFTIGDIVKEAFRRNLISFSKPITKPLEPKMPERKYPNRSEQIYEVISKKKRRIWLKLIFGIFLPIPFFFFGEVGLSFLIVLAFPMWILYTILSHQKYFEDLSQTRFIHFSPEEIRIQQDKLDAEYKTKMDLYRTQYNAYTRDLSEFNKNQYKQANLIQPHLDEILYSLQDGFKADPDMDFENESNPKKGVSENIFYTCLKQKFPKYIKKDLKLHMYYPDICMIIKNNWCIDIEIDEPYSFDNKEPIHYKGSSDDERDIYFRNSNWFVIRFAESQIINDLDKCVDIIRCLIDFLVSQDYELLDQMQRTMQEIQSEKWTYEEAEEMSRLNYRNRYLSKKKTHQNSSAKNCVSRAANQELRDLRVYKEKYAKSSWSVDEIEYLTDEEIDTINEISITEKSYKWGKGLSMQFHMRNGRNRFIPLSQWSDLEEGDNVDPNSVVLILLSRLGYDDIVRVDGKPYIRQ